MKSVHTMVLRIRLTMERRGITSNSVLADVTGLPARRLQDLMSVTSARPDTDERKMIADSLFVPLAWLTAAPEKVEQSTPRWAEGLQLPLPRSWLWAKGALKTNPSQMDHEPITSLASWHVRLQRAWNNYRSNQRINRPDTALKKALLTPTADERQWPLFHRAVAMDPLSSLSIAQQFAVGKALRVEGMPTYEALKALERQAASIDERCRPPQLKRFVGKLRLEFSRVTTDKLPSSSVYQQAPDWPLREKGPGSCYQMLVDKLQKTLTGRLTNQPLKHDRYSDRVVDEIVDVMEHVYRHVFPDDPRRSLYDAVRDYRAFCKQAYLWDIGTDEMPDRGKDIDAFWGQQVRHQTTGSMVNLKDLHSKFKSWGFDKGQVDTLLDEREKSRDIRLYRGWLTFFGPGKRPDEPRLEGVESTEPPTPAMTDQQTTP